MLFEVYNNNKKVVMHTENISCIPDKKILTSMYSSGYKFKVDGKTASVKTICDIVKEIENGGND